MAILLKICRLAINLAIAGHPPLYCPTAKVTGILPQEQQAVKTQRTRWEHGHLQTLITQVPRLLKAAIIQRRFDLLVLAFDLGVPPPIFISNGLGYHYCNVSIVRIFS